MSAEATPPPPRPPHRRAHVGRAFAPSCHDPANGDPTHDVLISAPPASADRVTETIERTEPDDETAAPLELFGKPVVEMEPGQFRLPEVHRHILAGRVVLLLPATRSPQPPPPQSLPPPDPTTP